MRWEQLQHPNGRHVGQLRLPSGPRVGGAPADRTTPREPISASASASAGGGGDGDGDGSSKAGQAAARGAAPGARLSPRAPRPRQLDLGGPEEGGREPSGEG